MYFKLLSAFFDIFIVSHRLSVESLDFQVYGTVRSIIDKRIASRISDEVPEYTTTSCGGVLTRAPVEIEQQFNVDDRTNVTCTWIIHAPVDHSVYVRKFETKIYSLPGGSLTDTRDSVDLQIYEETGSTANRCFNSKTDASLDKCISDGRMMKVVLNYEESGLLAWHKITLQYGFTERSDISDLLH